VEGIQWGSVWIWLVSRLSQRSFVYLVSVYVLDPNLQPAAPPLIRFENGVLGIVGNDFGGLFSALSFDFPSHVRSPMEVMRTLVARKSTQQKRDAASRRPVDRGIGRLLCGAGYRDALGGNACAELAHRVRSSS
jgi:hypothetical protein